MRPAILILTAPGTNREREAAWACEAAGGDPRVVPVDALLEGRVALADHQMLLLPGGFSYGDDLGAGKLWAANLTDRLGDSLRAFVAQGKPVLGICNGFQALVKTGLLPGDDPSDPVQRVTLHRNDSARFECRWVWLRPDPASPCVFTRGLGEDVRIHCPIAHGEGKVVSRDDGVRASVGERGLAVLRYVAPDGGPATYPFNPNGSEGDIAGLCNPAGNVLGLMPHPEDHILDTQHPRFHAGVRGNLGLVLFQQGVAYAASC
jgi:phosphoribosylformylglycinamidine synthase